MNINEEMKKIIKEAIILFMKSLKKEGDKLHNDKIDNAIGFIKQGWKYKEMWEAFWNYQDDQDVIRGMEKFQQKYLKEIK